jgi:hypothetical protein
LIASLAIKTQNRQNSINFWLLFFFYTKKCQSKSKLCNLVTHYDKHVMVRLLLALFLAGILTPLHGQDRTDAPRKKHQLHVAGGIQLGAARDLAYTPLRYTGIMPTVYLGYSVESTKKSEQLWLHASAGTLESRFGAPMDSYNFGIFNVTLFHQLNQQQRGWHWGWSNNNVLRFRDYLGSTNFSPRVDYHTSFGPAARYRYTFDGWLKGFQVEATGHLQVIGFFVQSGFVSNALPGYIANEDSGFQGFWDSLRLFYPGPAWDWSVWPSIRYTLRSGNTLSLEYRYEMTILEDAHRAANSHGFYLFTLTTRL